jgi:hypothetical protein
MPFLRYANARVVNHRLEYTGGWDNVRVASGKPRMDRNLVEQAEKILKAGFDPKAYLLTHATIVASVDTVPVKNARLGATTEGGKRIVRKTADYRIKADCDKYINNNLDSWARDVLLKSYKTFIGAHSFVEHVQIEDLSKGRIIDAVARDVGDSVYVDILVANDRKHTDLIEQIESGQLSTLSMGCSIDGSTCTKCGHWAADETEFCDHIRYQKGNTFFDENGQRHRIAELCGDVSLDPTGGVTFIEASWVAVPAFTGAVARNIVSVDTGTSKGKKAARKIKRALDAPTRSVDPDAMKKAANFTLAEEDPFSDLSDSPTETAPAGSSADRLPLEDLRDQIKKTLLDKVKEDIIAEISEPKPKKEVVSPTATPTDPNDTIIKQAALARRAGLRVAYQAAVREIVKTASSDVDLVNRVATLNDEMGVSVPRFVYRAALKVGASDNYPTLQSFLSGCRSALGREPTGSEAKTLLRIASILAAVRSNRRHAEKLVKEK